MTFTEREILDELDLAFEGKPSTYQPIGQREDITYNFFLDLEHGYCVTAGSSIHLYADATRWAIVFEKSGYQNRATAAEIELNYVGNCIDYLVEKYPERNYITNTQRIVLIDPSEFERIENKEGKDLETFELVGRDIKTIKVRDREVVFDNNFRNYETLGIKIRQRDNSQQLIGFGDLIRYWHASNPMSIAATEDDIRRCIPKEIPKLMTLDHFHFVSVYDKSVVPSQQETYQLIAKVLTTRDTTHWKPQLPPNNHWSNWESGNL